MNGVKEGKFLSFYLDNNKVVKYDLSTGEMIGVKGEPVKSLGARFSNLSMTDMIDSINPKEYASFLRFVSHKQSRISNFGTLLKKQKSGLTLNKFLLRVQKLVFIIVGLFQNKILLIFVKNMI